jgi:predicted  nucleic acid-binding Zn-ribbon protein
MANLADQTASLTTNVRTQINNIDQKATHINTQVDLLFTNHGKALDSLENTNKLLNEKITNLDKGFKDFGSQISKLEANNIENIQILAKNTLNISEESQKFFTNVLETESASDALVVIITKMMDGFNILENDLKTVETRVDSITGQVTTPRGSAFFTRMPSTRINTTNINQNE